MCSRHATGFVVIGAVHQSLSFSLVAVYISDWSVFLHLPATKVPTVLTVVEPSHKRDPYHLAVFLNSLGTHVQFHDFDVHSCNGVFNNHYDWPVCWWRNKNLLQKLTLSTTQFFSPPMRFFFSPLQNDDFESDSEEVGWLIKPITWGC